MRVNENFIVYHIFELPNLLDNSALCQVNLSLSAFPLCHTLIEYTTEQINIDIVIFLQEWCLSHYFVAQFH